MRRASCSVRDGYEKLSMRRVAERSTTRRPPSTCISRQAGAGLQPVRPKRSPPGPRLETLPTNSADPIVRLRKGLERYIAFGLNHPTITCRRSSCRSRHDGTPTRSQKAGRLERHALLGCLATASPTREGQKACARSIPRLRRARAWAGIHALPRCSSCTNTFRGRSESGGAATGRPPDRRAASPLNFFLNRT